MTAPRPATPALAAIDIGTNSIRLLVAAPAPGGGLTALADRTETVRLGTGIERTGRLDPERVRRAVATVAEFHRIARSHHAAPILVAATSAVRDAANGAELRRDIERLGGVTMAIIDGAREAELTFAGATMGRGLAGTVLVGDLGGGSLELVEVAGGKVDGGISLPLGVLRLHADAGAERAARKELKVALEKSPLKEQAHGRAFSGSPGTRLDAVLRNR